jgi:GT2 family glycosyltransferase
MTATQSVRVAVAVAVHNRRDTTLAGLSSLLAADRTGIDLRVVVCDDGSSDGTGDAIRDRLPEVEIVDGDGSLFYADGTNVAIRAALHHEPHFVLAINDDGLFDPHFLVSLVACAHQHHRSVVGALLVAQGRESYAFQIAPQWSLRFGGQQMPHQLAVDALPNGPFEVECIVGNCVLVPVDAIRAVGLLDGRRGWGDADWTMRMRRAGWQLLVEPAAVVRCEPNMARPSISRRSGIGGVRSVLFDRRDARSLRWQWGHLMGSSPTRWHALAAFAVYTGRMVVKALGFGTWPRWPDPATRLAPAARSLASSEDR